MPLARRASPFLIAMLGALLFTSPATTAVAGTSPPSFTSNWPGGEEPAAPVLFSGSPTWDVSIHRRATTEAMEPTLAEHGEDCSGVPHTHLIDQLAQGVFVCGDHLMTSISDRDYGQITLTPNQIVDFSSGPATIAFGVSTLRFNSRNWLTFWLSPWDENVLHPLTDAVDLQGPPRSGVRVTGAAGGANANRFTAQEIADFTVSPDLWRSRVALEQLVPPAVTVRTGFELDISRTHVRFGVPSLNLWWVDNDFPTPLPFDRAIFQIDDESRDPCRDQPGDPCFPDTWHWSDVAIGPSMPFTMLQGDVQAVTPATPSEVHFAAPAPEGSFLRFEAIGPGVRVGFDGGPLHPAVMQRQVTRRTDRWASYWMPVPTGTTSVSLAASRWPGGDWWIRDPAIWSLAPPPAGLPTPAARRLPVPAPPAPIPARDQPGFPLPAAVAALVVGLGIASAVGLRRRRRRSSSPRR